MTKKRGPNKTYKVKQTEIEKAPIARGLHSAIKEESRGRNFKPTFWKLTDFK